MMDKWFYLQSELDHYPGGTLPRRAVPAHHDCMSKSQKNAHADAHQICDDSLCNRRRDNMRSPSTSRNPVRNPRVNFPGDDRDGPIDK